MDLLPFLWQFPWRCRRRNVAQKRWLPIYRTVRRQDAMVLLATSVGPLRSRGVAGGIFDPVPRIPQSDWMQYAPRTFTHVLWTPLRVLGRKSAPVLHLTFGIYGGLSGTRGSLCRSTAVSSGQCHSTTAPYSCLIYRQRSIIFAIDSVIK